MSASHDWAGVAAWNFKLRGKVNSYEECERFIRGGPDFDNGEIMRDLGPRMYVIYRDGCHDEGCPIDVECYEIYLYETPIIRYYPCGTFSVDNGGHATPTTTERLQAVLPDGFRCYHFSTREIKGRLGLIFSRDGYETPWARRRKIQHPGTLWPLDHSVRISAETGEVVS